MYHYIPYGQEHAGGVLFRAPLEIREELLAVRELLKTVETRMDDAEERKEELILSLEASPNDRELILSLEALLDEGEELKAQFEALLERTDALREELSDAVFLLTGSHA